MYTTPKYPYICLLKKGYFIQNLFDSKYEFQ